MKTDFGAFGKSSNISIFKTFKFSILLHATTCVFMVSVFWKGHTRTDNGFYIDKIVEPRPVKEFEQLDPRHFKELNEFPGFLCIRAVKRII